MSDMYKKGTFCVQIKGLTPEARYFAQNLLTCCAIETPFHEAFETPEQAMYYGIKTATYLKDILFMKEYSVQYAPAYKVVVSGEWKPSGRLACYDSKEI